jgi:hypothetical protein
MNIKEKKAKSAIQQLRDIRDKISSEIKDLSYVELLDYLDKQNTIHPKSVWLGKKRKVNGAK